MEVLQNHQKTVNKMAVLSPYLPLVTLNVSGLNFLIKRYRKTERILKKADTETQQHAAYKRLMLAAVRTYTG